MTALCASREPSCRPMSADPSGALSTKTTPCLTSHSYVARCCRRTPDDLAIVVTVVGKAVGLDDRPVRQVAEEQIR